MRVKHGTVAIFVGILLGCQSVWALEIANVYHEPAMFEPKQGQTTTIGFRLTDSAMVNLNIYDDRDLLVRRIATDKVLTAGDHAMIWDGKDQAGRLVPPEAYRYTLTAENAEGKTVEYDISDVTGGGTLIPRSVKWVPEKKEIQYTLPKSARVNIRVGLKNHGPMLGTVTDWVPRMAGVNTESWDGKDASNVLELSDHPQLDIIAQAFALSENTIIVGPKSDRVKLIKDMPWKASKRERKKKAKKRMYAHAQQPVETRGDITISLSLPKSLPKNEDGLPIITDKVPFRLHVAPAHRAHILATRFEAVFFVDGQFVFESEGAFIPMSWIWDPAGSNEGVHYITANVRGYEGNFGAATIKVVVK